MNNLNGRNTDLKLQTYSAALIICLSLVPLSSHAVSEPNEENCRNAIAAGLELAESGSDQANMLIYLVKVANKGAILTLEPHF